MVKIDIENARLAIIGSTNLTKNLILFLEQINRPLLLMGLSKNKLIKKANSVSMEEYCEKKNICYIDNDSWDFFYNKCKKNRINLIIEFGDSRIIPSYILENIYTIGNHGALLPYVKGGASLVWGRMANLKNWGVSLMKIDKAIDQGEILSSKEFNYDSYTNMSEFIELSDRATMDCFVKLINKNFSVKKNIPTKVTVKKNTDTYKATTKLIEALRKNISIYMPPRIPIDAKINNDWPEEFIEVFKIANNKPYPKYY